MGVTSMMTTRAKSMSSLNIREQVNGLRPKDIWPELKFPLLWTTNRSSFRGSGFPQ
jgi:hypothetical protein